MKRLILVRHGETTFLRDQPDNPIFNDDSLNAVGTQQILALTSALKSERPDILITSTLKRAVESADILNEVWKVPLHKTAAFDEFEVLPDGTGTETTESGLARSLGFLNEMRSSYSIVCVVAHNSILTLLMSSILNSPYSPGKSLFPDPAVAYILSYDWQKGEQNWQIVSQYKPRKIH